MLVIDYDDYLLGIVIVDDIIDVIDDEVVSDYFGLVGVDVEEVSENFLKVVFKWLFWLIMLLFLGMFMVLLISNYELLVSEVSILVVFIFLIIGIVGNVGI